MVQSFHLTLYSKDLSKHLGKCFSEVSFTLNVSIPGNTVFKILHVCVHSFHGYRNSADHESVCFVVLLRRLQLMLVCE